MPSNKTAILTFAASLVAAYACWLVVHQATPIDRALPLVVVAIGAVAAVSHVAILSTALLLMAAEIAIVDERTRLVAFGVIVAAAFAAAMLMRPSLVRAVTITVSAIVILRWIPLEDVLYGREIILMLLAVAIVVLYRGVPLSVAVAVAVVFFTPAIPLRTVAFPVAVLVVSAFAAIRGGQAPRLSGQARAPVLHLSALAIALMLLFFPWSGAFARGLPLMLRGVHDSEREYIRIALGANRSHEMQVPRNARSLILSASNMPKAKRGTVIGRIDPGAIPIRIGDVADWGALRREQFYGSRNPLPRDSAGLLRGYGYSAWIDGAGRVALPKSATIQITADPKLAPGAALQIDAFEMESR